MINEKMLEEAIAEKNTPKAIAALRGGIVHIKTERVKWGDIRKGEKFVYFDYERAKDVTLTITYVRSGVAFCKNSLMKGEDYFLKDSLLMHRLEPMVIKTNLDKEYYKIVPRTKKTKVIYS